MSRRGWLLFLGLVGGLVVAAGLALGFVWRVPVVTVAATTGPAVRAVYATGVVEPVRWARVSPLVSGRLTAIDARDGDHVVEAQVLARLDDREALALVAELEAIEVFRREELARYARLSGRDAASRQAFERAASEHAGAFAALAAARQRVENLILYSPMDGTVLRQDGEVGEVVGPGDILFRVGRQRPLRLETEVDEEDIPLVRPGQRALIRADAFPGQVLEGSVGEITPMGDPVSKNYRVRVALPDDTPLLIGMTTEVNIVVLERRNVVLVPADAVADGRLWVASDGRAEWRRVEVGIRGAAMTEIMAGLEAGERVILDPPGRLDDGDRIRERPADAVQEGD